MGQGYYAAEQGGQGGIAWGELLQSPPAWEQSPWGWRAGAARGQLGAGTGLPNSSLLAVIGAMFAACAVQGAARRLPGFARLPARTDPRAPYFPACCKHKHERWGRLRSRRRRRRRLVVGGGGVGKGRELLAFPLPSDLQPPSCAGSSE